jgi:diguanylate cyclase (GGDEF)-like protein/putative nucleotidyltransferase with HDIG domain
MAGPFGTGNATADLVEIAEQNAGLRQRLQHAEQYTARTLMRATRLAQVIGVLGKDADLETTIERAAVELAELFSCDIAMLILQSDDALSVEAHWGITAADLRHDSDGLRAIVEIAADKPVGIATAANVKLPAWLAAYGPRHIAWAQLLVGDKSLGLMLLMRRADDPFDADEESELRAISYRIALAIENGLLHRHMRSQLAQLHRLQQLTAEFAGTIDAAKIGQRLAETLVAECGVDPAIVFVERDEVLTVVARAGDGEKHLGSTDWVALEHPSALDQRWCRLPLTVADRSLGFVAVVGAPVTGSEQHELLLHLVGLGALALEKALLYERSRDQARHDSLTGLLGHRVFQEVLEQQIAAEQPFGIALFDIDDFKEINDLRGHQVGDEVLREVSNALRQALRAGDSIFRVGGEEFYAVLPGVTTADAYAITERLRDAVFQTRSALPHPVTVSAGIATYPVQAQSRDELLAEADAALYVSKRAGKNRSSVAGEHEARATVSIDRTVRLAFLLQKDPDTVTHSIQTAILAVELARQLGLDDNRVEDLRTAAKLHDIGKIGIPRAILTKPAKLDEEEFRVIQTHPVVGAELLLAWDLPRAAEIVLQHHERIDGTGYPLRLAGEQIELESRIIHAADAWCAMAFDRPYRRALTREQATAEMLRHRGTQFDPRVVDALLALESGVPPAPHESEELPAANQTAAAR